VTSSSAPSTSPFPSAPDDDGSKIGAAFSRSKHCWWILVNPDSLRTISSDGLCLVQAWKADKAIVILCIAAGQRGDVGTLKIRILRQTTAAKARDWLVSDDVDTELLHSTYPVQGHSRSHYWMRRKCCAHDLNDHLNI
jgi:hypothetical protein